jgi:hypothetical protein
MKNKRTRSSYFIMLEASSLGLRETSPTNAPTSEVDAGAMFVVTTKCTLQKVSGYCFKLITFETPVQKLQGRCIYNHENVNSEYGNVRFVYCLSRDSV